jgi:hypothetical protein
MQLAKKKKKKRKEDHQNTNLKRTSRAGGKPPKETETAGDIRHYLVGFLV